MTVLHNYDYNIDCEIQYFHMLSYRLVKFLLQMNCTRDAEQCPIQTKSVWNCLDYPEM